MGFNPIATDIVGTRLMGFNWEKIHYIRNSVGHGNFSVYVDRVDEIPVISNIAAVQEMFHTSDRLLNFRAHPGWKGHIELD